MGQLFYKKKNSCFARKNRTVLRTVALFGKIEQSRERLLILDFGTKSQKGMG